MCLYTIFDCLVAGYVPLTKIYDFYPYCQSKTELTENGLLVCQYYSQLSNMSPMKAAIGQLYLTSICSYLENV